MRRLRFPGGHIAQGVAKLSAGVALAQLLNLAVYPVLTRTYAPSALGFVAVYTSIVALITTVSSLRYEYAVPLSRRNQVGLNVMFLAIAVNSVVALTLIIAAAVVPQWLERWTGDSSTPQLVVWLVPIGVLLTGTYNVLVMWAVRMKDYGTISRTKITQQVAKSTMELSGAFACPQGWVLAAAQMLSSGFGSVAIFSRTIRGQGLRIPNFKDLASVGRRYRRFALLGTPAALAYSIAQAAPSLLMASLYSLSAAGQFALASRVIAVPIYLVASSAEKVFFAEAARLGKRRSREILELLHVFTKKVLLIGAVPTVCLALAGPPLFSVVFGAAWAEAGQFVRALSIYLLASLAAAPFDSVFHIFEKQNLYLVTGVLRATLALGAFLVPHALGASAQTTITVYAGALTVYFLVFGAIARAIVRRAANNATPSQGSPS